MMQVWLPLNGNLDSKGASKVTVANNGATVDTAGKTGSCYYFDGEDDYMSLTGFNFTKLEEWTMAFWVYSVAGTLKYSMAFRGGGNVRFTFDSDTRFRYRDSAHSSLTTVSVSQPAAETWTHYCIAYDHGAWRVYKNGMLTNSASGSGANMGTLSFGDFFLGKYQTSNGSSFFNGKLNDFRIYLHAFSQAEAHELSQGLVIHYPLDNGGRNANLLKYTRTLPTTHVIKTRSTIVEPGTIRITPTTSNSYFRYITDLDYADYDGRYYTFSYDARQVAASVDTYTSSSARVYYGYSSASTLTSAFSSTYDKYTYATMTNKGDGWRHYTCTFLLSASGWTGTNDALVAGSKLCFQVWKAAKTLPYEVKNIKLEFGQVDTGYYYAPSDLGEENKIQDCSGYNNNGTIVGTMETIAESPRYWVTPVFAVGPYIKKTGFNFKVNTWTVSVWFKKTSGTTNTYDTLLALTRGNGADANKKFSLYVYNNKAGFVGETTSHGSLATIDLSLWHHVCITNDAGTHKYYMDGVLKATYTNSNNLTDCTDFVVGGRASASNATSFYSNGWNGNLSDVRLYCTALSAEDVLALYHASEKVDKQGYTHAYRFIEGSAEQFHKTGRIESKNFSESMAHVHYDRGIHWEPDGSAWAHVGHHNNPDTSGLFLSTDTFAKGVYYNEDKWYDVEQILSEISSYEFLVIQRATNAVDFSKYRWTQSVNPLTATYSDTVHNSVTINTSDGYVNTSYGGMYLLASSNMRMCMNSGTSGNWYGFGGSARSSNALPGYPKVVISTGSIDLYIRISPTNPGAKIFKNVGLSANQLIEF